MEYALTAVKSRCASRKKSARPRIKCATKSKRKVVHLVDVAVAVVASVAVIVVVAVVRVHLLVETMDVVIVDARDRDHHLLVVEATARVTTVTRTALVVLRMIGKTEVALAIDLHHGVVRAPHLEDAHVPHLEVARVHHLGAARAQTKKHQR